MRFIRPAVKVMRDGREVCTNTRQGRIEYKSRIIAMWIRQGGLCCLCKRPMAQSQATFEHQDGRGMGGAHRDDRIEKDGHPYNGVAHDLCNRLKGSRRMEYNGFVKGAVQ